MTVNNVLEIASTEVVVEGNRPLGRPRRRWKNYLKEIY
jgi:RNase P/RNase MRP subunit p29